MSEYRQSAPTSEQAWENFGRLDLMHHYLGNTVLIGISPDGASYQQVCWLLGRDEPERNRRFEVADWKQGQFVQTTREPENGITHRPYPTMLSYDDAQARRELHVVTTGDRTRAILSSMLPDPRSGRFVRQPFGTAADLYDPGSNDPLRTPRVSGLLSIGVGVKSVYGRKETHVNYNLLTRGGYSAVNEYPLHTYAAPGVALAAHAYSTHTGAPDEFAGQPYPLPLFDTAEATRDFWWEQLPDKQRVAIAVLAIEGSQRSYAVRNAA